VTRPQRTATDLHRSREDPEAVAQVVADALRRGYASPGEFAAALAPSAAVHGFRRADGMSLLAMAPRSDRRPGQQQMGKPGSCARAGRTVTAADRYMTPNAFRRALTDRLKLLAESVGDQHGRA
jgi:hypothetical protein